MQIDKQQREQLQQAYRGELYGIAFFSTMLAGFRDWDAMGRHRHAFELLLQVERVTAAQLERQLPSFGCVCQPHDEEMAAKGDADASRWLNLSWESLIDTMVDWVAPYQEVYRQQRVKAEQHHSPMTELFHLVDEHETAIYCYLLAQQRNEANATQILSDFIARHHVAC
ncbi:hypothetical protein NFHSH190041_32700 [Shewanella sp. NFH-SH190041]|nr:hypothetical protein NFHSH190041_32700 [Shewanella sp. NFH-SH190041]